MIGNNDGNLSRNGVIIVTNEMEEANNLAKFGVIVNHSTHDHGPTTMETGIEVVVDH